jgi:hypothetical protein
MNEITVKQMRDALEKIPDDALFLVYLKGWWAPLPAIKLPVVNRDYLNREYAVIEIEDRTL